MSETYEYDASDPPRRRTRPTRRPPQSGVDQEPAVLTPSFFGLAAAYGHTLLFIGFEVNGKVEITVYPRYRFGSDDRVQGHLGYVRVPVGTAWDEIIARTEEIFEQAQENYRKAVGTRSAELRAHGSAFETAYDAITEAFRESWHGFRLRLQRQGSVTRGDVSFRGAPPAPVLVTWRGTPYTVLVYSTGSILVATGDQRNALQPAALAT